MDLTKPDQLHGRITEWEELTDFVSAKVAGATLGLVYGRRRQGKTLMLELLARQTGGFFFGATQQSEHQNLADLGRAIADHRGLGAPLAPQSWPEALDELVRLGADSPRPVILDEFPYLVASSPGLPSYLQQTLSPLGHAKQHTQARLVLCGSALTTMATLLSASAPLRGRAVLELVVRPFGYREAAAFWRLDDPELAFKVHALIGGTPAYLEMSGGTGPRDRGDFDRWVQRRIINPASAMFREGSLLLREDPSIADPTSYAAILTALSVGHVRRSEIAADLGRPATSLAHLLDGLQDIGLVEAVDDALRSRRTVYRITEPVVRLYQLISARHEAELVGGRAADVWARNADTVQSKIYGPHFEDLARQWCLRHASPETLGGVAGRVLPSQLACRTHQTGHELDAVVWEARPGQADRILAIGEAKAGQGPVGPAELERLEHLRGMLPAEATPDPVRLILFGRSGFTADLHAAAATRDDVVLVDLTRIYQGS
ncbi:AAA family ATPase [Catellatospora tritici]|uniref:AAA family ATPase n=1 Tax=Catellatospora tritici TaxID=2851566 RepID=UPI0020C44812|nr:ATP-binding protein [Catellatospora tritici]